MIAEKVGVALDQPSLTDFREEIENETGFDFELRGANPTLVPESTESRDIRFYRLGLREKFWLRLVNAWAEDFAELAQEQGADVLAHLWRGLRGSRLRPEQRPRVWELAYGVGVVEAAQAMCAAVAETPGGCTSESVFKSFCDRCQALICERQRQQLPPPLVKRPPRTAAIDFDNADWMLQVLGIGGSRRNPSTREDFLRTYPGYDDNEDNADDAADDGDVDDEDEAADKATPRPSRRRQRAGAVTHTGDRE